MQNTVLNSPSLLVIVEYDKYTIQTNKKVRDIVSVYVVKLKIHF